MDEKKFISTYLYKSPFGDLALGELDGKLCLCDWIDGKHNAKVKKRIQKYFNAEFVEKQSSTIEKASRQLDEYFSRKRISFDIPLLFAGTNFQQKVWRELLKIPYSETTPYGEIAKLLGLANGARAVANACGANPTSIFAPCHRVIGSNNSLGGYDGGIERKKALLELELKSNASENQK